MAHSRGDWWGESWNPVYGCRAVSPGCGRCYAVNFTKRIAGRLKDSRIRATVGDAHFTGELAIDEAKLDQPDRWRTPRRVFVCSMSDFGHPDLPLSFFQGMCRVMERSHRHTYLILTKRPEVLRERHPEPWPPQCWVGVSAENSANLIHRWGQYDRIRWVSAEPLFGPLRFAGLPRKPEWVVIGVESAGAHVGRLGVFGVESAGAHVGRLGVDGGPRNAVRWLDRAIETLYSAVQVGAAVFVKQIPGFDGRVLHARNAARQLEHWPEDLRRWEFPKRMKP